jgi:TRAP-type C4-dicarboxylate transport system permease large subunit
LQFGQVIALDLTICAITPPAGAVLTAIAIVPTLRFEHRSQAALSYHLPRFSALTMVSPWPALMTRLPGVLLGH